MSTSRGPRLDASICARAWCKTRNQKADGTSLGVLRPFGVFQLGQSQCTGLPLRYRPLSRFLTFSAVSSCPSLATLFRVASALRIHGLQSFLHSASCGTSRCSLLSCCFIQLWFGWVSPTAPFAPAFHRPRRLAFQRVPCSESIVRPNARRDIISLAIGRNHSVGCERSRRLSRLMHKNSSRGSSPDGGQAEQWQAGMGCQLQSLVPTERPFSATRR